MNPYSPCIDSTAGETYFNTKNNWQYIGIDSQYYSDDFKWGFCVDDYSKDLHFLRSPNGSYWIHPKLVSLGTLKVMVYSGNTDLCGNYFHNALFFNFSNKFLQLEQEVG